MSRPTRHFPELSLYAFASGVYCECGFYVESDLIGDEPGHLATERVKDMWVEHVKQKLSEGQGQ